MPTYVFEDETGDVWEELMSISNMEEYIRTHDNIKIIPQAPAIVAGVTIKTKTDGAFQESMAKVAEAHPNSSHAEKYGKSDSKTIKTRELVKKHLRKK